MFALFIAILKYVVVFISRFITGYEKLFSIDFIIFSVFDMISKPYEEHLYSVFIVSSDYIDF